MRNTWTVISSPEIRKHTNILGMHFVHCIKDVEGAFIVCKDRLVVQGHHDREIYELVHTYTKLTMHSISLILAYAAIYSYNIWTNY